MADLHTSVITLENYLTILNSNKSTFWAEDFGFSGGAINALALNRFIAPTGATKDVFVCIDEDKNIYKKFTACQWKIRQLDDRSGSRLYEDLARLSNLVEGYKALAR